MSQAGTVKLTWRGDRPRLEAVATRLTDVLFPPADAVSLEKADPTAEDQDSEWSLAAYFEGAPDMAILEETLADLGPGPADQEVLPDRDWVAEALEGLGIVEAGGFVLYGSHDADRAEGVAGHRLLVEANRAFGTGHHPTTAGCLTAIGALRDAAPARILDLGTGSGVLAMAARRLWPDAAILGTDIDAPSVQIAAENAHTNGIDDIDFRVAEGVTDEVRAAGPFDLVLANILAEPLSALAPDIAEVLAPGGYVVLAGLLDRQEEGVATAYERAGLAVRDRTGTATWPVLTCAMD